MERINWPLSFSSSIQINIVCIGKKQRLTFGSRDVGRDCEKTMLQLSFRNRKGIIIHSLDIARFGTVYNVSDIYRSLEPWLKSPKLNLMILP